MLKVEKEALLAGYDKAVAVLIDNALDFVFDDEFSYLGAIMNAKIPYTSTDLDAPVTWLDALKQDLEHYMLSERRDIVRCIDEI